MWAENSKKRGYDYYWNKYVVQNTTVSYKKWWNIYIKSHITLYCSFFAWWTLHSGEIEC